MPPSLSKTEMDATDLCTISADITNLGQTAGYEIVQLYIRDDISRITRPVKELKAFRKVWVEPGQTVTVSFEIGRKQLEYYGEKMELTVEPGTFTLMIGSSSKDEDLQKAVLTIR